MSNYIVCKQSSTNGGYYAQPNGSTPPYGAASTAKLFTLSDGDTRAAALTTATGEEHFVLPEDEARSNPPGTPPTPPHP